MEEIKNILNTIRPDSIFEDSINFINDGLLDSIDLIRLIAELEKTFNISIKGFEMIPENFVSYETLEELVKKYKK